MTIAITGARWTPRVNMIQMKCQCGKVFEHRADRWWAQCPECRNRDNLGPIRNRYVKQGSQK
jgi:hypothetical protein